MVGIGSSDVNLDKFKHTFCSLLGKDADSWGLSYTGKINRNGTKQYWLDTDVFTNSDVPFVGLLHHKGKKMNFSSCFGQGSIIGVHLDTWHGTLTFFKNRKCIG